MLHGRRFALIVEDIQVHSAEVWLRLREFLRGCLRCHHPEEHGKATGVMETIRDAARPATRAIPVTSSSSSNAGRNMLWPDKFFRANKM